MKSKFKISILFCLVLSLFLGIGMSWAAKPASEKEGAKPAEVTKPSEPGKKEKKLSSKAGNTVLSASITRNVWVAMEKINERKFSQSVHGANSCNSCHWDITDVKEHPRKKGPKSIPNQSPAIDVIKRKRQNIMQAPISSMTFNVKTVIKTSTR